MGPAAITVSYANNENVSRDHDPDARRDRKRARAALEPSRSGVRATGDGTGPAVDNARNALYPFGLPSFE